MKRLRLSALFALFALVAVSCGDTYEDEPAVAGNSATTTTATEADAPQDADDPAPGHESEQDTDDGAQDAPDEDSDEQAQADDPETSEPDPAEGQDEDSSRRGGTLVVALTDDPGHFNPGITTGFNVHAVTGSMFNGLVELDDNANPHPDLAVSWDVSDDSTEYTFGLAQDVRWHDGEDFTSADVRFSFENVLLQYHSRTKGGLANILESITTPDDHTVVFKFTQPYAALLQRLNSTEAPILPEHVYANVDDVQTADANLNPVGTGPFKFESYAIDDQVTLVRNDDYFKAGLPYLDRVVYRVIPDENTQVLALEQGEVDYVWRVPGAELERLGDHDAVTLYGVNSGPGGGFCVPTLTFNLDREVFSDIRVRQAIAHAVNRDQLLAQVLFGSGNVATGPISSAMEFAYTSDVTAYPLDLERADALLTEAGYPSGDTRFSIDLLLFPAFVKYGEIIRQNLSEVGIDVQVTPLDRSAFLPTVFGERNFDTNIISYCNNTDPSIGVSRMYRSNNIGDIPFSNGAGYVNPTIDEMFQQAASTADPATRGQIYGDIQRILVDDLPYLWLLETRFTAGSGANVNGLMANSGHFAEAAWFSNGG